MATKGRLQRPKRGASAAGSASRSAQRAAPAVRRRSSEPRRRVTSRRCIPSRTRRLPRSSPRRGSNPSPADETNVRARPSAAQCRTRAQWPYHSKDPLRLPFRRRRRAQGRSCRARGRALLAARSNLRSRCLQSRGAERSMRWVLRCARMRGTWSKATPSRRSDD